MIIEKKPPFKDGMPPIHPGEYIAEDLEEWGMSAVELDAALAVPAGTTAALVAERLNITPELALRLSHYMCISAEFWLGIQAQYNLKIAERKHGAGIIAQVTPLPGVSENPYKKSDYGDRQVAD